MKKKVIFITSLKKECGVGRYSQEFLKNLVKYKSNEIEVFVITHKNFGRNLPKKIRIYNIIKENVPTYVGVIKRLLEKQGFDYLVVEWEHSLYSPLPFFGSFIFPVLKRFEENLILSFHTLYKIEDVKKFIEKTYPGIRLFSRYIVKWYSFTKNFLMNVGNKGRVFSYYQFSQIKNKKRFYLIPEGIENVKPLSLPSSSGNVKYLLIFGFIRESKDYKLAIETLSVLPKNYKLLIVGKALNKNLIEKIKKWSEMYNIKERVKVIQKFVSEKEKIKIFNKSSLILLPYKLIANSGIMIDGIKFARPIVSTVLKEDVEELKIGEYSPPNPDEFAYKIEKVMDNYTYYYKNILDKRKNFFWNKIIENFSKYLLEI